MFVTKKCNENFKTEKMKKSRKSDGSSKNSDKHGKKKTFFLKSGKY